MAASLQDSPKYQILVVVLILPLSSVYRVYLLGSKELV